MTKEFRDAADKQSRSLGFEPGILWVPHPIQNRTPAELEQIAEDSIEPILGLITATPD